MTDITGLDSEVKSQTIVTTAGDNGKQKPSGATAKTLLTSNEYTAKVPTTSYPPSLKSKTSSLRLPRINAAELNYFYNSRIPSLDATGINQNYLARHTTDQSLQHASQPGDFKLTRELTPRTDCPVWPAPAMTETNDLRHRWPQSSVLHPSVVGYQTGGQSNWNDEPPSLRLRTVKSHTPVVCPKATATVTELQPRASVTSWSVPSYSYQSSVLPENGEERFLEPSTPNSFTENQEQVHPVTSSEISPLRREDQRNGALALSPEFPDDPSLAALERKVAEACEVVERVMKEREERTKAQREAARKKREMREQREREAREMREREARERREREERERKEREQREREEREIKEREERDRREQIENEGSDTRWFGGLKLRHRWAQSSVLHPSVVSYQTGGQSTKVPVTGHSSSLSQGARPRTSSSRFPLVNWTELDYVHISRTPSLEAIGINQSFLARHTTDQSLQHASQPGDFNRPKKSTPRAEWPMWSLPPPDTSETRHRWPQSSRLHHSEVRDKPPTSTLPTVKSHPPEMRPSVSTPVTELQSRNGAVALSPEFPDDHSLAALERKVAEACVVVERVMREREERTKARREAARKKREMRKQREKDARQMREREERKSGEREEREEREMKERERREKEKKERKRREPTENEERETKWFGGERAPVQESPRWQCEHYQRRCSVKFPCCGTFYPCHRCHNTSGVCDTDDRKAKNATHVKCGNCGHEEEINEGSQYCSGCGEQMSAHFCLICKRFSGEEKQTLHYDKWGIRRIHKDKSFHCDICNVCLDKRLEGKHKCRPDSGHGECCLCLEDAFSGCQILPCSHKVHKECTIAMIQKGVRICPICHHPLFSQDSQ